METLTVWDHFYIAAICGCFGLAIFKSQPQMANARLSTREKITLYWSNSLFLYAIAALALSVWILQGRSLVDLGFRLPRGDQLAGTAIVTVLFLLWYAADLLPQVVSPKKRMAMQRRWKRLTPFMPEYRAEVYHVTHLSFCAGVTEEIVFRGFFINYLCLLLMGQLTNEITNPLLSPYVWLAVLIPTLIFAISHLYSGWSGVLKTAWLAGLFGWIYVLSGSLLIVVVLHIVVDIVASWISPWIMNQPESQVTPSEA